MVFSARGICSDLEVFMARCQFCLGLGSGDAAKQWDRPLLESPNFIVIPSIGAMVEGWLLITPKRHHICMGSLDDALMEELLILKKDTSDLVRKIYGDFVIFEHGPAKENRLVGCSVDHAHLHIVPGNFDLISGASKYLKNDAKWTTCKLPDARTPYRQGIDYLYAETSIGQGALCAGEELGSQIFRKVIANCIGKPDMFNWRENPFMEITLSTISKFEASAEFCAISNIKLRAC